MEEDHNSRIPMARTGKIIRRSIHTFLQNYQYFTSVHSRLQALFRAAGFPLSSEFFTILSLKLSQTISSSVFALPFTLTFLLFAKASVIQALNKSKPTLSSPSFSCIICIFNPLLLTYIFNTFLIISANATAFCLLFLSFNFLEGFGFSSPNSCLLLSAAGAVLYSIILANALITCNLALVLSGGEKSGGFMAFLKACVMIRGRTSTALSLALPASISLAGIEALFQYRIVRPYNHRGQTASSLMVMEGMLIAYLYSVFIVLDTVATCIFLESCNRNSCIDQEEGRFAYRIEILEEDYQGGYVSSKATQELP
ncbi:uncharacterized protein LOC8263390 isoform X2 [Ricinus communis]|uniref:uncharacterized protein LOC8263390 isoform X2 n=1 Tax=Ricinus communis TaxID=3988 RepID=UPI000D6905EF|nr:uncharacterized protein LOC8263390 isoform X2 [Ricinus communis]|eukprot:XP_025012325.1 uncharacterized protein LOC8263390 isoform X2 [Ricinus communis]